MSLRDRRPALLPVLALAVLTVACGGDGQVGETAARGTIPFAANLEGSQAISALTESVSKVAAVVGDR
jgi:hypothetical protein